MPMIVVGGQHRKIGKTALVTAILRHFPQLHWQGVKFTSHMHDPGGCELVVSENGFSVWQQRQAALEPSIASDVSFQPHVTDTARYLAAGAAAAFLVQYETGALEPVCHWIRTKMGNFEPVIAEATSAAEVLVSDFFMMILDPNSGDIKPSAARLLPRADAYILTGGGESPSEVAHSLIAGKPLIHLGLCEDEELLWNLICKRLAGAVKLAGPSRPE